MQDALALAKTLSNLKASGKDIGLYKHLRSYERARKTEAAKMIAAMDGFKFLFDSEELVFQPQTNSAPLKPPSSATPWAFNPKIMGSEYI